MSANLERMLKAAGQKVPGSKPILEINPHHPLVQRLKVESDAARFDDLTKVLFDQSLLAEGGQLDSLSLFELEQRTHEARHQQRAAEIALVSADYELRLAVGEQQ